MLHGASARFPKYLQSYTSCCTVSSFQPIRTKSNSPVSLTPNQWFQRFQAAMVEPPTWTSRMHSGCASGCASGCCDIPSLVGHSEYSHWNCYCWLEHWQVVFLALLRSYWLEIHIDKPQQTTYICKTILGSNSQIMGLPLRYHWKLLSLVLPMGTKNTEHHP